MVREFRTVTLTDRPPVRIRETDWPELCDAGWRGNTRTPARERQSIRVRVHADGRHLVYGVGLNVDGGELLPSRGESDEAEWVQGVLIPSIKRVAKTIGRPDLAADLVAGLPAVVLE